VAGAGAGAGLIHCSLFGGHAVGDEMEEGVVVLDMQEGGGSP